MEHLEKKALLHELVQVVGSMVLWMAQLCKLRRQVARQVEVH
jgi:hypothetical protein